MSAANDVPITTAPEMAFAVHGDIEPQFYHLCQFEQVVAVFAHRYLNQFAYRLDEFSFYLLRLAFDQHEFPRRHHRHF